jgi:hypothetical protein
MWNMERWTALNTPSRLTLLESGRPECREGMAYAAARRLNVRSLITALYVACFFADLSPMQRFDLSWAG